MQHTIVIEQKMNGRGLATCKIIGYKQFCVMEFKMDKEIFRKLLRITIFCYLSSPLFAQDLLSSKFIFHCESIDTVVGLGGQRVLPLEEKWVIDFEPVASSTQPNEANYKATYKKVNRITLAVLTEAVTSGLSMHIFKEDNSLPPAKTGDTLKFIAYPDLNSNNSKGQFTSFGISTNNFNDPFIMYGWSIDPPTVKVAIEYRCNIAGIGQDN